MWRRLGLLPPAEGRRRVYEYGRLPHRQQFGELKPLAHHRDYRGTAPAAAIAEGLLVAVAGLEVELPWAAFASEFQDSLKDLPVKELVGRKYE